MNAINLLFIYTDEQVFDTLAAYGNDQIEMPRLNRFSQESLVLERCYVTQPVCTPSRSSLLTGLWPQDNGCWMNNKPLNPDVACFPERLRAAGGKFTTAHIGKWHLGDEIFAQHGFDTWESIEDDYWRFYSEGRDPDARCTYHDFLVEAGEKPGEDDRFTRSFTSRLPENLSKTRFVADRSIAFLERTRRSGEPFVLFSNFLEPHMPFYGPRDGQYDPEEIPLPENYHAVPSSDLPYKYRMYFERYYKTGESIGPLRTRADWRRLKANYWGLCSQVDTHAGRILDALRESGRWDETLIVFTSDHGDMMGAHRLTGKCVMYEEAVRVPLLIKLPGQKEGRLIKGNFSHIDLVPTLLDLMGYDLNGPAGERLAGHSRSVSLAGGTPLTEDVFIRWQGTNAGTDGTAPPAAVPRAFAGFLPIEDAPACLSEEMTTVITPELMKYTRSEGGRHTLFDLKEDPGETVNLYWLPGYEATLERLEKKVSHHLGLACE